MNKFLYKILGVALGFSLMACSDDASDKVAGGSSEDAGIIAVENWDVAGVSQKGPFVTGSKVTVQELDGVTFNQTGNSFSGRIKSDRGDFSITGINLSSQYAILEASGYYRDEISGKKSSGTVDLRAITDLSNRKTVNINLLTHLEYERVMELISKEKLSVAKAKARAEKEIFEAFGIKGEFAESEDLDIFGAGDANAALLAVSVLMQSDVDVAGLTERIGNFSIAFAEEGAWDDADTKAKIADWASNADLRETLPNIRKNIEGWKYADSVPPFEKYVTNFWWQNYGLGDCTKKREGEVKSNINKLSELYEEFFVCESGRWIIPGKTSTKSSSSIKANDKNDAKSSSSIKADDKDDAKSSDSAESSSSKENPFVSSSSVPYADSVPTIPEELSFLDEFVDSYNGYMEFGEGKQKDWLAKSTVDGTNQDSALAVLADTLDAYGFEYAGKVLSDVEVPVSSFNWLVYNDSSFAYQKKSEGLIYKVYIVRWTLYRYQFSTDIVNCGFDLKIVTVEDGFEEQSIVDRSSLRFETDVPEDVRFANDYFENISQVRYNDDSLTSLWRMEINTPKLWDSLAESEAGGKLEMEEKLNEFMQALVKEGFTKVGTDTVDQSETNGITWFESTDGKIYRTIFEKETDSAKYRIVCYTGAVTVGDVFNYSYRYAAAAEIYTQYKKR